MWRIRKNRELRDLYGVADIVAAVKGQTFGHVVRMKSDRSRKMELERKPEGVRTVSYTHLDVYKRQATTMCAAP